MNKLAFSGNSLQRLVLPVGLLAALELSARASLVDPRYIPTPAVILAGLGELGRSGVLWEHVATTVTRVLTGAAIAILLGVSAGLFLGYHRRLRQFIGPTLDALRSIPSITLLPLTILWFGLGSPSQVPIIAFAALFPILINSVHGADSVPPTLILAARAMEIRGLQLFSKVILPASAPHLFTGVRLGVVTGLTSAVGAEIIAGTDGLGFLLLDFQRSFATDSMFATMIVVAALGLCLNGVVVAGQQRVLRFRADHHYQLPRTFRRGDD